MGLRPVAPGLRVLHNSNTPQKVQITPAAGVELIVPIEQVDELRAQSTHFEVDPDEYAKAKAAADEIKAADDLAAAEAHHRAYHRLPDDDSELEQVPEKAAKAAKKTTVKKSVPGRSA